MIQYMMHWVLEHLYLLHSYFFVMFIYPESCSQFPFQYSFQLKGLTSIVMNQGHIVMVQVQGSEPV